jgi:hypothetical protein
MLEKVPTLIETYNEAIGFKDVNDALEFYNISLFIRNQLWLLSWSEEYKEKLMNLENPLFASVARFFSTIDEANFNVLLTQTDNIYREDFLSLLCETGMISKISWSPFSTALENNLIHLYQILHKKKLVDHHNLCIRQTILSNPTNAELILNNLSNTIRSTPTNYFPKGLTNSDVNTLFMEYINSPDPNLNYIQQIANYKNSSSAYRITKEVIYAAKIRYDTLSRSIFEDQQAFTINYSVSFKQQNKIKSCHKYDSKWEYSYDVNWIKDNLEYLEVLYNFAFLFEWFDRRFGITLISKPNSGSIMEQLVGGRNTSDYFTNLDFMINNDIALQQIKGYYHILKGNGILLEDVFHWFYTDYLEQEFSIKDFYISFPSNDTSFYEKCKSIAPEFESILKQYASLSIFKRIDHPYIENVNPPIDYINIPSLCINNYAYPNSDEIKYSMFSLFSSQSMCYYLPELGNGNEECLFNQILKHKISYSSLESWQKPEIDRLINLNILSTTTSDEIIQINDINLVLILKDLFTNGFVSPLNYPEKIQPTFEEQIKRGYFSTTSSLLSIQEGNYFEYHLNDSTFGNSLGLRNKYAHGTPGENSEQDYFTFLKMMALLTIKIDNDLQNSDMFNLEEGKDK